MSQPRVIVPDVVREALDATGMDWVVVPGRKHHRVLLSGRQAAVLSRGKNGRADRFNYRNTVAMIRRTAELLERGE